MSSTKLFRWASAQFYSLSVEDLNQRLRALKTWPSERRALRILPKQEARRRSKRRETRALIKLDMVGVVEVEPDHLGRDIVPVQILRVLFGDDYEAKIPALRMQADTYVEEVKRDPTIIGEKKMEPQIDEVLTHEEAKSTDGRR